MTLLFLKTYNLCLSNWILQSLLQSCSREISNALFSLDTTIASFTFDNRAFESGSWPLFDGDIIAAFGRVIVHCCAGTILERIY